MTITKLATTDAFVAIDLIDPPEAAGIVRSARKILQGGAEELARSATYTFASFEHRIAGASAGINAEGDARTGAVAAFVAELLPEVAAGRLHLDAAKGVEAGELAEFDAADTRNAMRTADVEGEPFQQRLAALGPLAAAEGAIGSLTDKTVVIEGFGETGPTMCKALAARGAKVIGIGTTAGTAVSSAGWSPSVVRDAWSAHGEAMVSELGGDAEPAWKALALAADVVLVGSKTGVITHANADKVGASAVVPHAALPFTTKALLMMQRAGKVVVPDFLACAGWVFAGWPSPAAMTPGTAEEAALDAIRAAVRESAGHADGLFLGACARAEAFLASWQPELPFGRPLAP